MAIGNVNSILSMLRRMSDTPDNPELQRFAAMHRDDPFILPLVIGEDTARKEMRAAQQARMMGNDPRKVNDQAIAAIGQQPVPSQGAGQVPAGLPTLRTGMANMADGGIAGYPDEDEVPRYNGATGSVTGALDQAQAPVIQSLQQLQAQLSQAEQMLAATAKSGDPQALNYYAQAVQALRTQISTIAEQNFGNRAAEVMSGLSAAPAAAPAASAAPQMTPQQRERFSPPALAAAPPGAAPRPGPGPGAVTRPAAAAPAAVAPSPAMAPPTVAGAKETAAQFLDRSAIERQSQQYLKDEDAAINQARMRREAAAANQGKAYTGREALLKKEEEESKGQLEQSKAFAIINAGLAMMAGSSPNALKNIAEGAMVGTKQYQGAISDFNKAAKERQKAMADIENARRAEDRDDAKAQLLFEDRADERMANARKFGIDAIMGAGIKSAEIAARIYDNNMTQAGQDRRTQMELTGRAAEGAADRATRLQIANIQAAARSDPQSKEAIAVARVQAAINGSPMLKALAEKAKFDPSAAAQYAAEEERLYLRNAPELLIGQMAPGAQSSARSAADAILQKKP